MSLRPKKRSLTLQGHRTSVTLEDRFWRAFCDISQKEGKSINQLAIEIDLTRDPETEGLASAIRDFVLKYYMDKVTDTSSSF